MTPITLHQFKGILLITYMLQIIEIPFQSHSIIIVYPLFYFVYCKWSTKHYFIVWKKYFHSKLYIRRILKQKKIFLFQSNLKILH